MESNHLFKKDIDTLLINYVIGDIEDADRDRVNTWLAESKENRHYFEQLKDIHSLGRSMKVPSGFDPARSLDRIKSRYYKNRFNDLQEITLKQNRTQFNYRRYTAVAASILLILSLGFNIRSFVRSSADPKKALTAETYNEIYSPLGSRTHATLPDGTQVWLNAGSSIRYPMDFLQSDRNVVLTGEAYFDVKKYSGKKFIVNTSDIAIQVWGTKFNVKAYPDETTIKTTLVEGSISIIELGVKGKKKETYLSPNQTAVFYKNGEIKSDTAGAVNKPDIVNNKAKDIPVEVESEVNTVLYTSWKDKKWFIEGESLGTLARELERRYNVIIRFDNEAIKKYRFTGIITEETFEQILEIIRVSAPVDYLIKNNEVVLTHNMGSKSKYEKYLNRRAN